MHSSWLPVYIMLLKWQFYVGVFSILGKSFFESVVTNFITGQYTEFSSIFCHLILVFPIAYEIIIFFYSKRFKHQVELKYFLSNSLTVRGKVQGGCAVNTENADFWETSEHPHF